MLNSIGNGDGVYGAEAQLNIGIARYCQLTLQAAGIAAVQISQVHSDKFFELYY
jgi:hypothetical protein